MKNNVEAPAPLPPESEIALNAKRYLTENGYLVISYKRFFMVIGRFFRLMWWLVRCFVCKVGVSLASLVKARRQKKIERAKANLEESVRNEKELQEQLKALEKMKEELEKLKEQKRTEEAVQKAVSEQLEQKSDSSEGNQNSSTEETQDLSCVVTEEAPDVANKRCQSCQAELPLNARFCRKCGTKVA